MASLHNIYMWQSHRSGYWVCEIHDRQGFKAIGLGRTKELATQRASAIAGIEIPKSRIPQPVSPTSSVVPDWVSRRERTMFLGKPES